MNELVDLGAIDKRLAGLERPASTGLSSGLSRALAERLGFDVLLVRIGFIFLALFTGLGFPIYLWGTLLTPRVGSEAPITRFMPGFGGWSRSTQLLVVGGSTLGVGLLWGAGSAGAGLVIAASVVLCWLALTRKSPSAATTSLTPGTDAAERSDAPSTISSGEASAETYEAWQERMRSAVEPYPVLQHQPAPAAVPVRRGWWAGLLVLAVGAVAGAAPFLLGAGSVSVAAASAAAAMGVTVVLLTLLRRSRRIPGVVLLLCLVLAAGTVVVTDPAAQFHIATESVPGDGDSDYDYIYAGDIELDLRDREGQVTINAVASQLQLLLPEGATVEVNHLGSDIELPETETQAGTTTLHVEINALASTVTGTYE